MRVKKISIDKETVKKHGIKFATFVRNVIITVFILIILAVGAGILYTWYMSNNSPAATTAAPVVSPKKAFIEPTKPADNVPVGAAIHNLTSPVMPGMNASVSVKTTPDAECSIIVEYNKIPSTDSGLKKNVADKYGMVTWAWTVEETVPYGTWPVKITCALGKRSAYVQGDLKVQSSLDTEQ